VIEKVGHRDEEDGKEGEKCRRPLIAELYSWLMTLHTAQRVRTYLLIHLITEKGEDGTKQVSDEDDTRESAGRVVPVRVDDIPQDGCDDCVETNCQ
jgi:hypothetical protein